VFLAKDPYWLNIIAFTYLMGGLAASWNIIGGFGGQFSLGHGVFFGIGAYVTAIATSRYGLSPWLVMVPAAVLAALVAMLISCRPFGCAGPSLRLPPWPSTRWPLCWPTTSTASPVGRAAS
jgi:branched-chain amino acid transport system permease protein